MVPPTLIDATSKLLGWSLSDLTIYGAQPITGVVTGVAASNDSGILGETQAAAGQSPDIAAAPAPAGLVTGGLGDIIMPSPTETGPHTGSVLALAAPTLSVLTLPASAAVSPVQITHTGGLAPFSPEVIHGAGPAATAQNADAGSIDHGAADATVPIAPGDIVQHVATSAGFAIDPAHTVLDLPSLAAVVHSVEAPLTIATPLADAIASTAPLLTGAADAALTHVGGAVAGTPAAIDSDLPQVGGTVAGITSTVGALVDDSHAFAGADPAGGIVTLVGMVETADPFHLASNTGANAVVPTPILDTLADDAHAVAPLLGDVHHDLAVDDAHHHGLGGLL